MNTARGRVVHVLPYDEARGAQRYAQALVDVLQSEEGSRHVILTLFAADHAVLDADIRLEVPKGFLRRVGLDPRVIFRLRREIERVGPRAVVAHGGESAKYSALALGRATPFIYLKIGTADESIHRRRFRRMINSFYAKRAALVVGVSSDVADQAREMLGVKDERLLVIPNARQREDFTDFIESEPHNDARLIYVGNLNEGKRPEWFVDVVRELGVRGRKVKATMVGSGPLEDSLRPLAEELEIEMLGVRDDVSVLLASSDIFVFTSRPAGEGMPGVLIEAGLSGLATVSTRVPGARDVIADGDTGLLVDIEDKEAMVEAVDRLVADPSMRRTMGERARERCVRLFTFEATARLWHDAFGRVGT